jgi:multiple sugar transport system permease protein
MMSLTQKRKAKKVLVAAGAYIVLGLVALLIILPFVQMILASLKPETEILKPNWIPKKWAFDNYAYVFRETPMMQAFGNTFLYILPPVIVGTFMSALCAYGFARLNFPGKKIIFSIMMLTLVIPGIIILIPAYVLFANFYHWVGTPLPIIVPGLFGSTVQMFFFLQYMRMLPRDVEEASRIDGLNYGGIFLRIVLPLSIPAVITQLILSFNGLYNDYLVPLLYLGSNEKIFTVQLAINYLNRPWVRETEKLLAACVIALAPTVVIFIAAQKYFVEGIAITGMK